MKRRWLVLILVILSLVEMIVSADTATSLQDQVVAVYESAGPAVVHITARGYAQDIFSRPVPVEGAGSGFLYDTEGHIVTNYHVVADAEAVTVAFESVQCCEAEIVGTDPSTDLAVLHVDIPNLPTPLVLTDSDELQIGQFVVAIGNPFGLEQTLTFGVISALGRVIKSPDGRFIGEVIQTDATINPGNSGGPLLDLQGRVIGVNAQIISPSGASVGIGFAVSSNTVRRVVPELIAHGRYPHPFLGISGFGLSPQVVQTFREAGEELPMDRGVLIIEVSKGSPAEAAGLRGGDRTKTIGEATFQLGGDIILAINDQPVNNVVELTLFLEANTQVGETVEVAVLRGGTTMVVPVTLGERLKTG